MAEKKKTGDLGDAAGRIEGLKKRIGSLKTEKTRLETSLEEQTRQYEALRGELTEEGFDPDKLDEILEGKEAELSKLLDTTEKAVDSVERDLEALKGAEA